MSPLSVLNPNAELPSDAVVDALMNTGLGSLDSPLNVETFEALRGRIRTTIFED